MADTTRKINITNQADDDATGAETEETGAEALQFDDDEVRVPINLDAPVGLADALAELQSQHEAAEKAAKAAVKQPVVVDDPVIEATDVPAPDAGVESKAVNAELERLRTEAKQANDNYVRAIADLQNFRRRGEEEKQRIIMNGNEKLIREILPILDDFDLALEASKKAESYEQLIGGVDAILRKFRDTLAKQGVEAIPAVGETFNPDLHEAVVVDEASEEADDTVTMELRKGYTLHSRVIRPSLVKVAKQG